MSAVGWLHQRLVFGRRARTLAGLLSGLLPANARVLDVGCGDGTIDRLILEARPDLRIEGVDVLTRPQTRIPVTPFDGHSLPFRDDEFDVVTFTDVLHHTSDPAVLLREARRTARRFIIVKDHLREGFLAGPTLRFMDWIGNAHHGVALPYNYLSETQWMATLAQCDLQVETWTGAVALYPFPASLVFNRRLHFVARLLPSD